MFMGKDVHNIHVNYICSYCKFVYCRSKAKRM